MVTFYNFKVGDKFLKVGTTLKLRLVDSVSKGSYFKSKSASNSWMSAVKAKYPDAKLVELTLVEKTS
jgi:hypothetical protein